MRSTALARRGRREETRVVVSGFNRTLFRAAVCSVHSDAVGDRSVQRNAEGNMSQVGKWGD